MLVNFCFQVVLGRLFRKYIRIFDVVLKCLSAWLLRSKPHLGHAELDKRKKPGVNFFHYNVSQFLLSSCPWKTPSLRIHLNFWCSFKVPERLLLPSKPLLEHVELDKRKLSGVNIDVPCNVSQFLLSCCPWRTPSLRIHSNFRCSFKVPERLPFLSKLPFENVDFDRKKKPGVNICLHRNINHFLLSSSPCRSTYLRIHLNFWCSFKVPERLLFAFKTSYGACWVR